MKKFALLAAVAFVGLEMSATQGQAQAINAYSNVTTFSGQSVLNGGATNQAGNTITNMVMDDLTFDPSDAGLTVSNIVFSVRNNDAAAVTARPRLRFWLPDGAGGGPGTYFAPGGTAQGYTFNPIT